MERVREAGRREERGRGWKALVWRRESSLKLVYVTARPRGRSWKSRDTRVDNTETSAALGQKPYIENARVVPQLVFTM